MSQKVIDWEHLLRENKNPLLIMTLINLGKQRRDLFLFFFPSEKKGFLNYDRFVLADLHRLTISLGYAQKD